MTRYQAPSQRAAGAARTFPSEPRPRVIPTGLSAWRTGPLPSSATVPAPAPHTSTRERHSACQLSRSAVMRSGSARRRAHHAGRPAPPARKRAAVRGDGPTAGLLARSTTFSRTPAMASSAVSGFMTLAGA